MEYAQFKVIPVTVEAIALKKYAKRDIAFAVINVEYGDRKSFLIFSPARVHEALVENRRVKAFVVKTAE